MEMSTFKFRCTNPNLEKERFKDDNFKTSSSDQQEEVEESVQSHYECLRTVNECGTECPLLWRDRHIIFLKKGLTTIPQPYESLDSSRPWLCYWILHSLDLLDELISNDLKAHIIQFLARCQCPDGGFGGGPGQQSHLAPTYAAVNALCILGTEEAYEIINREKLQQFLFQMKNPDGSFSLHKDSEVDVRGAYCALAVARLTNIYTPELFEGTADWVIRCQTYEGGFGGVPGMEAHGGYTFCGFASLVLLGREQSCNIKSLLRWLVNRQMRYEGGFQGRTNKLVDGCYSFWQGGAFPLIHRTLSKTDNLTMSMEKWLFNQIALQEYLLVCCQAALGGLLDKPGKNRDFYHTCYTLSGLSIAQHFGDGLFASRCIVGNPKNELAPTHPVYNIGVDAAVQAMQYFRELPVPEGWKNFRSERP